MPYYINYKKLLGLVLHQHYANTKRKNRKILTNYSEMTEKKNIKKR